jgi:hypothetical protein
MMRKALLLVGTLVVLLIATVVLVPVLFKDRILAAVLAELERHVDATVTIDAADVTLLARFPDLELTIDGLTVTGRGAFDGVRLARVGEARAALDLASVVGGGTVRVRSLRLDDVDIHVLVDDQGRANTDLATASATSPDTSTSTFALDLEDYTVTNLGLTYEDRQGGTRVTVDDLDASGRIGLSGPTTTFATKTTIAALTVNDLLQGVVVAADLALTVDTATGAVTLGENTLALNALPLAFRGTVVPQGDNLQLDLSFSATETSFGAIFSLLPAATTRDVAGLVTSGTLALQGSVKGVYRADAADDLPGFDLTLQVADGAFRYPSLPTSVDGIQLDIGVRHPQGSLDLAEIDVPRFAMAVGGSPLTGSLRLRTPISDPDVAAKLVGQVDLGLLQKALPPSAVTYEGRADIDLDVAGRVSQFTAEAAEDVKASGTLRLDGFRYTDPAQPAPVVVDRLLLTLDPRRADLAELSMRLGASDLRATGTVDNAIAWALTDATLVGRMDVVSTFLDLDALAGDAAVPRSTAPPAPATPPTAPGASPSGTDASSVVVVPTDLDFTLTARAARVRYGGHDGTDAVGTFTVKDGAVRIDSLRMGLLGGTVAVSGRYAAPTDTQADVDLRIDVVDFDVGETVAAFRILEEIVPVARGARGRFRSGFRMQARLGRDLAPDLQTFLSNGTLRTQKLTLEPALLSEVAERLGNRTLRTLDLNDTTLAFDMKQGRIALTPTSVKLGGASARLGGSAGAVDRTLDLDLDLALPVGEVKATELLGKLGVVKGGTANVKVDIGGTYDKPTFKLDLGDVVGALEDQIAAVVDTVTDRLLAEATAQGDALVAEAERQATKLKAEVKRQADGLKAQAKKQADKLASEAKGNPLAEVAAKEARKRLLAEADKQIDRLNAEADKKADAAVDAAKRERTKLLKDAEAKAKGR